MPKITIREEDLTSAGVTNVSTNAVYIPGYAVMGPVNTPTLCETSEEFRAIFGTSPYRFRNIQKWPTDKFSDGSVPFDGVTPQEDFVRAGAAEKSWVMAADLLENGLPVIFERVSPKGAYAWTGSLSLDGYFGEKIITPADNENGTPAVTQKITQPAVKLKSATPGLVSEDIRVYVEEDELMLSDSITGKYFVISVERLANEALGTTKLEAVETKITFNKSVAANYSSIQYYKDLEGKTDNSGLLVFESFATTYTENKTVYDLQYLVETEIGSPVAMKLPDETTKTDDEFTVADMYAHLTNNGTDPTSLEPVGFERLEDRGEYELKFITSGAYPVFEYDKSNSIASAMLKAAGNRGDAIALIDHTPKNDRPLQPLNSSSVYASVKKFAMVPQVNTLGENLFTYAGFYTPWGIYQSPSAEELVELPGSFAYLNSLAASVQVNPNWYAIAGVARGIVPNLTALSQNITNAVADSYTPRDDISINPITRIRPYGLTIWGNRTLKNNAVKGDLTATSFMNVRNLVCDVKHQVFVTSKRLTFEQNNDVLWINWQSMIIPLLEEMLHGNGITAYKIVRQKTTKKATLKAKIILYCVEAVEDFDIMISLADSETTISE